MNSNNKQLTVINMFAGPGAGKSTTAAALFAEMKRRHYDVELVSEYIKGVVWEGHANLYTEQDWIFAHQHRMIRRLVGKVKYAIVDSPLLLSTVYAPDDYYPSFNALVAEVFNSYNNINFVLERPSTNQYQTEGRFHSAEQARQIDTQATLALLNHNIPYFSIQLTDSMVNGMIEIIDQHKTYHP